MSKKQQKYLLIGLGILILGIFAWVRLFSGDLKGVVESAAVVALNVFILVMIFGIPVAVFKLVKRQFRRKR